MAATTPFPWPFTSAGTELHTLFENAPVGMAQCDCQGLITAVNPALKEMLGSCCSVPMRLHFADLLFSEDRHTGEVVLRELFSGKRSIFEKKSPFSAQSRPPVFIQWRAWRVIEDGQASSYLLLLAEDIDGLHKDELHKDELHKDGLHKDESRKSDHPKLHAEQLQAIGRMAGSVAHDFNNLLTGILLYCDLMLDCLRGEGFPPHDRLRNYVEEIRTAGEQATGIVRQLLSLSRPRNLDPHPLSLNEIAAGMHNLLDRLIGENIELSLNLNPRAMPVKMDSGQARQILLNLVLNARDAMPAGGRILIETSNCHLQVFPEGATIGSPAAIPCVLLSVSDNGAGMTEETRQRALEPHFTTKSEGHGDGLGLATVHEIVAGYGGLLQLDSAPDRGTRVIVLLPAVCVPQLVPSRMHDLPRGPAAKI